jgi:hypothetical protein
MCLPQHHPVESGHGKRGVYQCQCPRIRYKEIGKAVIPWSAGNYLDGPGNSSMHGFQKNGLRVTDYGLQARICLACDRQCSASRGLHSGSLTQGVDKLDVQVCDWRSLEPRMNCISLATVLDLIMLHRTIECRMLRTLC